MRLRETLMMRRVAASCIALLGVCAAPAAVQAGDQIFRVDLNKTQILRLPAKAGSIVVGNPMIADVSVHSTDMIFVVGRGYGETNLVILDRNGNTMMDADIQVTSVTPSYGVRLFKAENRQTYSCAPYCQPSPILGDEPGYVGDNTPEAKDANSVGEMFDALFEQATGGEGGSPNGSGLTGSSTNSNGMAPGF